MQLPICGLRRHGHSVCRGLPQRVGAQIDLCNRGDIGGVDRIAERLFVAAFGIVGRQ